jgi:hypothetical protein
MLSTAFPQSASDSFLQALFGTLPLYQDRESRLAVQKCLVAIISSDLEPNALRCLVETLKRESHKPAIAVSTAFVLVEWSSVLMQYLAGTPDWEIFGNDILLLDAEALAKCHLQPSKPSMAKSAVVVTRRAFRKLLGHAETGKKTLEGAIMTLTAKQGQSTAKYAITLGIIAGVCTRLPSVKPALETFKPKYYEFYAREIVGSRTAVPSQSASGLSDFFSAFCTAEEIKVELMPTIEKGLLRSPEVILTSVLKPLMQSLPHSLDLSGILEDNLLKPLLSNVKSSNAVIREGSVEAFHAIIIRCNDEQAVDRIVQEIAAPLKSGKLASPDQRALHARMLENTSLTVSSAEISATSLAAAASKEGNEGSLSVEARAMAKAFTAMLIMDKPLPAPALESMVKGLSDKKPAIRKAWLLAAGRILRSALSSEPTPASVLFVEAVMPKLLAAFEEAASNAAAAAQSGLIVAAYILSALAPGLSNCYAGSTAAAPLSKASVIQRALNVTDKQPFLLNYRIYNKLSAEEDLRWLCHSLCTVSRELTKETGEGISIAWSEAVIYLITVPSLPSQIQREMIQRLSELYAENPELISNVVIAGLWHCLKQTDAREKDAKIENTTLVKVIRCICLSTEELRELNGSPSDEVLEAQASSLLVLARPELIPKANWIDSVLHMGIDPGALARKNRDNLLKEIGGKTSPDQVWMQSILLPKWFTNYCQT